MKSLKKILSVVLIVSMLFTTQGFFVLANGLETTAKTEESKTHVEETSSTQKQSFDKTADASKEKDEDEESETSSVESEEDETSSTALQDAEESSSVKNSSSDKESSEASESIETSESSETSDTSEESFNTTPANVTTETSETKKEIVDEEVETATISETEKDVKINKEKEIVDEKIETATTSETEKDVKINKEKDGAEIKIATLSETDILFGDNEKVASESDIELPKIIDNFDEYSSNVDVKYVAPYAEPKYNGLFGADPIINKWDSREHNTGGLSWVSPVRTQSPYGICWAFATAGMFETSIRKKGLATTDASSNLSELALAYFMYNLKRVTNNNNYTGEPGIEGHDYTMFYEPYYINEGTPEKATFSQCGGNQSLSTRMLTSYVGMVVEDENTNYTDDGTENDAMRRAHTSGIDAEYAFNKNAYVANNIRYINRNDRNAIKQAIMDNGSVGFSYYSESNVKDSAGYWVDSPGFHWEKIDGKKISYYHSQDRVTILENGSTVPKTNHAIMIVGWDDTIEKRKFYYGGTQPIRNSSTGWEYEKKPYVDEYENATYKSTSDGAWLARNSWGTSSPYMDAGYFYIPYDEPSLSETFYSVDAIKADTYKYNYHYDTTGNDTYDNTYLSGPRLNGNFGNIYKVSGTDQIQDIEAVNIGINSVNAEYDVKIYTSDTAMTNPTDGTLKSTKRCSNTLAGFYTFELDDKVQVMKDTYFSIVVEPVSTDEVQLFYDTVDDSYGWYMTFNESELGQSYYRYRTGATNYTQWIDMNSDAAANYLKNNRRNIDGKLYGNNWRIKALANPRISISFIPNGGEGVMASQIIEQGVPVKLNKNLFKKSGYRFVKWTSSDGNEYADEAEITINNSVVLTAVWEEARYVLTQDWYNPTLSSMTEKDITSIKIMMYPTASPSNVDASWEIPGSSGLIASRKGTDVFIYAPDASITGKIDLPVDSSFLFSGRGEWDPYEGAYAADFDRAFTKCKKIENLNLLDTANVTNMRMMFWSLGRYNMYDETATGDVLLSNPIPVSLDVTSFDTHNVTNMQNMFDGSAIRNIDISNFDTYSLTNVWGMFGECGLLESLDLSNFGTATISNASAMFTVCQSLASIDLSGVTFENARDLSHIFSECPALTNLDLSSFKTANVNTMEGMFMNSTALQRIMVSQNKFKLDSLTESSDMFTGCTSLRGGNNTGIAGNPVDATYARIDKPAEPGYFTSADAITVTFDLNGKGDNFTDIFEKGSSITRPAIDPTYEGYTFVHWYKEGTSENTAYDFAQVIPVTSGNTMRLIAKWTVNQYQVDYNLGGVSATKPGVITKTYGTALTEGTLKNPSNIPTGYTFVAWYSDSTFTTVWTGTGANQDLTTGTTAQTIYAKWKVKVTFNVKGHGTLPSGVSETNDIVLGGNITLPTLANVTGYTFDTTNSWYERSDLTGTHYAAGYDLTVTAPKDLYAKWNENNYAITYLRDGGNWASGFDESTVSTRKYTQSMPLPVEANIIKTGYRFLGWYKQGDTSKTVIANIAANTDEQVTVVAKWVENTYNITLNENGGEYVSGYNKPTTRKYTAATTLPTNNDIKKTGYRLEGWHEQSNFSDAAVVNVAANTDAHKTFYAKWELVSYAVTLNVDSGTIVEGNVTSYTYGTGATLPTNVTKAGFVFKGWWTQNGKTSGNWGTKVSEIPKTVTGAKTYYARWVASFAVTFDLTSIAPAPEVSAITNVPGEQNIEDGGNIIRPIDPSAANFEFKGWFTAVDGLTEYNFGNTITATTTIYAKWEESITYDLTFNVVSGNVHPAGADIRDVPEVQHIVNGKVATKPNNPSAIGYKFVNWYNENTFKTVYNFANAISASKTIYAKWELQKYGITYQVNGGTFASTYKVINEREYTKEVTLPTAGDITKYGYTFSGWYEDDTFTKPAGTKIAGDVTKDVILYASWTKNANTFIITLNSNYDGRTVEQAFMLGDSTEINANVFTRDGYTFIRWKDSSGNVYTNTSQLTGDIVLYAEWQENPKPYYPSNGGSSSSSGGSGGGSRGGTISIQPNQNNNQALATQVKVSTVKSDQIVVYGNTSQWTYDPDKNTWKMFALDLMGTPVNAKNGFYILAKIDIVLENNIYVQKVSNETYYFDTEGNMVTGWVKTNDNRWYFFNNDKTAEEGKLCLGWKQIDGAWYFFSTNDGSMLANTTTSDGYKIGADGKWIQT